MCYIQDITYGLRRKYDLHVESCYACVVAFMGLLMRDKKTLSKTYKKTRQLEFVCVCQSTVYCSYQNVYMFTDSGGYLKSLWNESDMSQWNSLLSNDSNIEGSFSNFLGYNIVPVSCTMWECSKIVYQSESVIFRTPKPKIVDSCPETGGWYI